MVLFVVSRAALILDGDSNGMSSLAALLGRVSFGEEDSESGGRRFPAMLGQEDSLLYAGRTTTTMESDEEG